MMNFNRFILVCLIGSLIILGCKERCVDSDNSNNSDVLKTTVAHFNTVIATVDSNNGIVFSSNIGDMISNWETEINYSEINVDFDDYFIEQNNSKYYIIAKDSTSNSTSAVELVLENGSFYERSFPGQTVTSPPLGETCTCSGCESTGPGTGKECQPRGDDGGWYCTDCSQGTCTKSVTFKVGGGLIAI